MSRSKALAPIPSGSAIKKMSQWIYKAFKLNMKPTVKVYHGFGDEHKMEVFGHAFKVSPHRQDKFSSRILHNTVSLIRLFMVKPFRNVPVELDGYGLTTVTDENGFFKFEFKPKETPQPGWHTVRVKLLHRKFTGIHGEGKVMVPTATKIGIISDIDDTFLVSHSNNLRKRLYVLFTKNAKTRRPFNNVVKHYQLLAKGDNEQPRPFFYVSSSEWNLYDYIRDFSDANKMPDGIYLLNELKEVQEFLKTGQNKHEGKYFRIARLLLKYPERRFILMGDDTQSDPTIYYKIAQDFPKQIVCIYLRHVNKYAIEHTREIERWLKKKGVEICYYSNSKTAIEHSRKMGLID
jgi:phosphatidate phosphatase APP1